MKCRYPVEIPSQHFFAAVVKGHVPALLLLGMVESSSVNRDVIAGPELNQKTWRRRTENILYD